MAARFRVVLALTKIMCTISMMLSLLGAMQSFQSIAVMTSALMQSLGSLGEFSIMIIAILPLLALILYNANIADEQLSLPSYLASFMVLSTLSGVFQIASMHSKR